VPVIFTEYLQLQGSGSATEDGEKEQRKMRYDSLLGSRMTLDLSVP
jgi:hypothetical protein